MDMMLFFLISIVVLVAIFLAKGRGLIAVVKFAYPNAKYNAIGNPYVSHEKLDSLTDLKSLHDFVNVLEKDYNLREAKDIEEVEAQLKKARAISFYEILNDSPKPIKKFFQRYFEKYEIEIIKNILRAKLENEEIGKLHPFGEINEEIIFKLKEAKDAVNVINLLKEFNYFKDTELIDNLNFAFENYKGNFLEIDSILDRYYFNNLKNTPKEILRSFSKPIKQIINLQIDIMNIKILLRAKQNKYEPETFEKLIIGEGRNLANWKLQQLYLAENLGAIIEGLSDSPYGEPLKSAQSDYEKTKDIFVIEKALDNFLLKTCMAFSFKHVLTSGPMLRFLISKEFEIRNLRSVARGIHEKINVRNIKKLLIVEEGL